MRGWRLARWPGLGPGGVVSQGPPPPSPRLGRPSVGSAPAAEARSHLLVPGESALGGAPPGPQTTTRPSQDPRSGPRLFPKPAEAQSPHTTAPPRSKGYLATQNPVCFRARPGIRGPGCGGGTSPPHPSSKPLHWSGVRWARGEDP